MKSPRHGLSRHLQVFFETELCGRYRFDRVAFLPAEKAPLPEGWSPLRRSPFGKWRELVAIRFGIYDLSVASPNETPPLGEIRLVHPDGEEYGPLDTATWQRIGKFIREREEISNAA